MEEYKKRHDHIWPELKNLLVEAGIHDYLIALDQSTNILFATQVLPDDFDQNKLSNHPVMQKWWAYMADIMETNDDLSPVGVELEEMFYLE